MNTWEYTLHAYPTPPEDLNTLESLKISDESAAYYINKAEEIIERLKNVRKQYAERATEIERIESGKGVHNITLERFTEYSGKITFTLNHTIAYPGCEHVKDVSSKKFDGRNRHKAIREYKRLQQEYPAFKFSNNIGI